MDTKSDLLDLPSCYADKLTMVMPSGVCLLGTAPNLHLPLPGSTQGRNIWVDFGRPYSLSGVFPLSQTCFSTWLLPCDRGSVGDHIYYYKNLKKKLVMVMEEHQIVQQSCNYA